MQMVLTCSQTETTPKIPEEW